jgi:hypothetical protein
LEDAGISAFRVRSRRVVQMSIAEFMADTRGATEIVE